MNRRGFFRSMLTAACTAAAARYMPSVLEKPKVVYKYVVRSALPPVRWRRLHEGVAPTRQAMLDIEYLKVTCQELDR